MRSIHFDVQGFSRTYWDLFVGSGFFVSVFLLFAAVLAWQLAGLSAETLALLRRTAWATSVRGLVLSSIGSRELPSHLIKTRTQTVKKLSKQHGHNGVIPLHLRASGVPSFLNIILADDNIGSSKKRSISRLSASRCSCARSAFITR